MTAATRKPGPLRARPNRGLGEATRPREDRYHGPVKHIAKATALVVVLSALPARADCPENAHYVAPSGSDGGAGTETDPWATIDHAIDNTGPGDCVYVRAGQYETGSEFWIRENQGGTAGAWWSLEAYPGEQVILLTRVYIEGNYTRVRGFTFPSGVRLLSRHPGHHHELLENRFSGAYTYAPISVGGDDVLVEGNLIELDGTGTTQDHGIYVMHGTGKTIRGNVIVSAPGYGIHVYDEDKYTHSPDIAGVLVEGNIVVGSVQRSGIIAAAASGVNIDDVTLRRNVLVGSQGGITVWDGITAVAIEHNTLVDNGQRGMTIDAESVTIVNNIVWGATTAVRAPSAVNLDTNLYGPGNPAIEGPTDDHALFADPLFVDPAAGNYRLQESSPAIDVGVDLGQSYVGAGPDLGAYEFGADEGGGVPVGGSGGTGGSSSGGAGGSGATTGGGGSGGGYDSASDGDEGCGCRHAGRGVRLPGWLAASLLGVCLRRRRRYRAS